MYQQLLNIRSFLFYRKKVKKINHLSSLLRRLSILLQEGYTFSDSIQMLLPYHVDDVDYWKNHVDEKFRGGGQIIDILQSFSIPKHYLVAIKIAEDSGGIQLALKNVANQMEFNEMMRNKLGKLLVYPTVLLIFIFGIFLAFRTFFLPNLENIINSRSTNHEFSSLWISNLFLHLPDFILIFGILVFFCVLLFVYGLNKQSVEAQSALLLKIPIVNYFYRLHLTRTIGRSLGNLIVSGFSLQQALQILKQQQLNLHLSYIMSKLEKRIIYGDSLSNAALNLSCFFPKFDEFIKHGEKSGYLGRELLLYCELLDDKLQSIVKTSVAVVQPLFFILIAVCIIAAYLSVLLPMYNLIEII
ncbi:competence type IV pilus assembly protein ComGB [Ureibacillus composti]|nr:competence type IV pilus assembly protein ComGB [Ureibacillus composti]